MAAPAGRRLRPLAVVCALLMVVWGLVSAGSLVAQIMELNDTGWPDENADGEIFGWIFLYLSAASSGCWVAMWGLFGLAFRPPLHLGALALVVAIALEMVANVVQANYIGDKIDTGWSFSDQLGWYGDRVTFQSDGLVGDGETRGFFVALPLVTAFVPLVAWLVVLFSGAGRKQRFVHHAAPYPLQYPQPYPPAYPHQYPQQPYPQQPYPQQPYAQPQYPQQPYQQQPYAQPQYPPQQYQQPAHQPPPEPRPQPRVPWQQVPPVVPRARPAPPPAPPPDQQETLPYRNPSSGS